MTIRLHRNSHHSTTGTTIQKVVMTGWNQKYCSIAKIFTNQCHNHHYYRQYQPRPLHIMSSTPHTASSRWINRCTYRKYNTSGSNNHNTPEMIRLHRTNAVVVTTIITAAATLLIASMNHSSDDTVTCLEPNAIVVEQGHMLISNNDNDENKNASTSEMVDDNQIPSSEDNITTILNWSGTHSVQVSNEHYWEPETIADVEQIVQMCHTRQQSVRPIGSALSPNGIAFSAGGMISLTQLDQIVQVDTESRTVTVQAGARVSQVVDALRQYQLTLPNLASIAEQQMGGFIQVGAHGTGMAIAPVDHYVTRLKLVAPSRGTITLTEADGELFHMAKVGLGCLGVVVEVTMQCIPAHQLREHTFVLTRREAKEQLDTLLHNHKHMRYMWIPYTDTVVCVTNDPVVVDDTNTAASVESLALEQSKPTSKSWFRKETHANDVSKSTPTVAFKNPLSMEERLQPLVDLLLQVSAESSSSPSESTTYTSETIRGMGFGALRDAILAANDPLDIRHVKRCNEAEAEFWKRSEDYVVRPSDELLQFDCGGQVRILIIFNCPLIEIFMF
jgi:FAD binding domain/D-arabinono-1,4-lactone oxidase